jgi:hypothetical protein
MFLYGAMREIHAHNIHASLDHVIQDFGVVSRRTKGRDYLGSSLHVQLLISAKKTASERTAPIMPALEAA